MKKIVICSFIYMFIILLSGNGLIKSDFEAFYDLDFSDNQEKVLMYHDIVIAQNLSMDHFDSLVSKWNFYNKDYFYSQM